METPKYKPHTNIGKIVEPKNMETLYRKVAVSERLPNVLEDVIVIKTNGYSESMFLTESNEFWSYNQNDNIELLSALYWFEPIPDPTAQLEADKKELLGALEAVTKQLHNYSQVWNYDESKLVGNSESLIQKHKQ